MSSTNDRLRQTLADVLDQDPELFTSTLSKSEVEEWDSLSSIRLIVSLEREFGVEFDLTEIAELDTVGQLEALIDSKLR